MKYIILGYSFHYRYLFFCLHNILTPKILAPLPLSLNQNDFQSQKRLSSHIYYALFMLTAPSVFQSVAITNTQKANLHVFASATRSAVLQHAQILQFVPYFLFCAVTDGTRHH